MQSLISPLYLAFCLPHIYYLHETSTGRVLGARRKGAKVEIAFEQVGALLVSAASTKHPLANKVLTDIEIMHAIAAGKFSPVSYHLVSSAPNLADTANSAISEKRALEGVSNIVLKGQFLTELKNVAGAVGVIVTARSYANKLETWISLSNASTLEILGTVHIHKYSRNNSISIVPSINILYANINSSLDLLNRICDHMSIAGFPATLG